MMPKPDQKQDEEHLVPVSALQHYLFCPRQCALIHIEQQWAENGATTEGRLLHERVDSGVPDRKRGVRTLRTLPIRSFALGVYGKADAVELHGTGSAVVPYPIEYKRGSPKPHHADEVQLCAQALCLEEMFDCAVPEGALFYDRPHRRTIVQFDQGLRDLTQKTAQKVQNMFAAGKTPQPVWNKGCKHCSLEAICQPRRLEKPLCVEKWFLENLED